ncbi:MAG: porphobilinogen synthase [Acidobacteria bacterium]|nr:MAG: porphobilinogen synthase [Acidobacteriota bacterium]PIE91589.1 MAG: porphobilinogen synthase [Acidobacteriota bacterium]
MTSFPGISHTFRPRRLRVSENMRSLIRENHLHIADFIYPLFIRYGEGIKSPIPSMPNVFQFTVDKLEKEIKEIVSLGIQAVILFGIPEEKDPVGLDNFDTDGVIARAIREVKRVAPELLVVSDICLCEYTDHGHCGLLNEKGSDHFSPHQEEGYVLNDQTLDILGRVSTVHAEAGADIIAPSGMMDGMVEAIRYHLDDNGFQHIPIMSYSVKYASSYYGPFRDAADGAPKSGDRKSHQMDPANVREALKEAIIDREEGADFLMVKPALAYLDVIREVRNAIPELPMVAYNVSGEYAMVKAATANGWLDEKKVVLETMLGMKRAGADLIISYHSKDVAKWLREEGK